MNAYLVSHNGLGDNLFMIGGLRFLLNFYNTVYFLCKNKYYNDIKPFFEDSNIICIAFNENNEINEIKKIINSAYSNNDVFVCGPCHKSYLKSKITNKKYLEYKTIDKNYTINFDTIDTKIYSTYDFIEGFYKDLYLNLTYFYEYFYIPITEKSLELYNLVKRYNIIFIQISCSDGRKLNITNLLNKYIYDNNTILISCNNNLYKSIQNKSEDILEKYTICEKILLNSKIINYNENQKQIDNFIKNFEKNKMVIR